MWEPRKTFHTISNDTMTRKFDTLGKTRFYQPTGMGRDDYIWRSNGGFCPSSNSCKIYEKGEFLFQKQRHVDSIPAIHSKSLMYHTNGGGRDTYIASSAGGLTKQNTAGEIRNTFYNGLRSQDFGYNPKRCKSGIATRKQREDFYTKTQGFKSHKSIAIQSSYRRYQKSQDNRLALPKPSDPRQKKYRQATLKLIQASRAYGK
ncbi:unnamed protein product [Moneuplotes crassus]|uniref:Uncharacterized protein n=1 Tax=Euplotes crassus TaxID=5936 RepID=A0AAD2D401_EUPCR|nr:unnamed protein product [Moneuplotes crassus]|mmetsp:Transcript_36780/g.36409  ORF Transcript_36780/g.36409 Transcript_36780/m.36409 type:complete len:203 (-) Transcript_36780:29-637(-)